VAAHLRQGARGQAVGEVATEVLGPLGGQSSSAPLAALIGDYVVDDGMIASSALVRTGGDVTRLTDEERQHLRQARELDLTQLRVALQRDFQAGGTRLAEIVVECRGIMPMRGEALFPDLPPLPFGTMDEAGRAASAALRRTNGDLTRLTAAERN